MHQAPKIAELARSVIAIVGPTASGKTELAVALARRIGGEIISVDSRQIYRGLDAGTAKPKRDSKGRLDGVPYHLVDCVNPTESFDAGKFRDMAQTVYNEIRRRGRTPILAGGTGLYLRAFCNGLSPLPPGNPAFRRHLEKLAGLEGREVLHERLAQVDPDAAERIPVNNIQRVVRALEVFELTSRPISKFWAQAVPYTAGDRQNESVGAINPRTLRIEWPAAILQERIISRATALWPPLLEEVRRLMDNRGYNGTEPGFQSLGYREALLCLKGDISEPEGFSQLIRLTLAYAKRQRTWFRHQMPTIEIAGGSPSSMLDEALTFISRQ